METKSLLYGLIGFFIGGLLVSIVATTTKTDTAEDYADMSHSSKSLEQMTGDEFDKAFIRDMIAHHEGAIEMAKLADTNAKHTEIKELSKNIITAQEAEVAQLRDWQKIWNYSNTQQKSAH